MAQRREDQLACVEYAARVGNADAFARLELQRLPHRFDDGRELARRVVEHANGLDVAVARRAGDKLRHRGDGAARGRVGELGAEVEIGVEAEMSAQACVKRPLRQAAVAHAGEDVQPLRRDPVSGAFVAEDLAPAAGAGRPALALAIADRARAGDDVDSILSAERACPGADHVVAAAIAAMSEERLRQTVQQHLGRAVLAVSGKTEKRICDGAAIDSRLAEQLREPGRQHLAHAIYPDLEMI